jgi:hypothetical protein
MEAFLPWHMWAKRFVALAFTAEHGQHCPGASRAWQALCFNLAFGHDAMISDAENAE